MRPRILPITLLSAWATIVACNRSVPAEPKADPAAAAAVRTVPPATPTPLLAKGAEPGPKPAEIQRFGAPIQAATLVSLGDVAKSPASFNGKTILTNGTVRAVCQERGCWMEITDKDLNANVRMHGHSFFVPKNATGKQARVQGTIVLVKDGKACEEMAATGAQLELDATGIELM